jgi:hypothetical protein
MLAIELRKESKNNPPKKIDPQDPKSEVGK